MTARQTVAGSLHELLARRDAVDQHVQKAAHAQAQYEDKGIDDGHNVRFQLPASG